MEEHDAASSLRARIMEIQRNSSLSPQEKGRQIQLLMTSRYRTSSDMVAASPTSLYSSPRVTYRDEETKQEMGCKHYIRAASIKAPCCDQWFPCRLCHDESVTTHRINRYEVLYMFCYYCELEQPFSGTCRDCGKAVGAYSCSQCKFLTSNPNAGDIFHCDQCGLCRVGPRERYEHCEVCHMCMPAGQVHRHIENAFQSDCPICGENMFTSTRSSFSPKPCGHPIHSSCFKKHLAHGRFACPICNRTDIDMTPHWRMMDQLLATNPIPEEYSNWKVEVLCNDCQEKTVAPFHFYGARCHKCRGYNTRVVQMDRGTGVMTLTEPEEEGIPGMMVMEDDGDSALDESSGESISSDSESMD